MIKSKVELESEYLAKLVRLEVERKEKEGRHQEEATKDSAKSENNKSNDSTVSFTKSTVTITTPTESTPLIDAAKTGQHDRYTRKNQQSTVSFRTAAKEDKIETIESKVLSILSSTVREQEEMLGKNSASQKSTTKADKEQNITSPLNLAQKVLFMSPSSQFEIDPMSSTKLVNASSAPEGTSTSEDSYRLLSKSHLPMKSLKKRDFKNDKSENNSKHSQDLVASTNTSPKIPNIQDATKVNEMTLLNETDVTPEKSEGSLDVTEIKRLQDDLRAKLLALLQKRVDKLIADLDLDYNSTSIPTMATEMAVNSSSLPIQEISMTDKIVPTMKTTTVNLESADNTTLTNGEGRTMTFKQIPSVEEKDTGRCSYN
ncbi:hypothetical protein KIN20_002574 [Parelaphostrongylus tenuis]|uniref:Uncharacterized protein n=1 Tax=Parelaphostrongylus tenuis TaxID=148309 RepID=A0AAD5MNS1_PARTN|nr:hypothetical protein KIN20_002574 [Parelaphostrongylus tenuis]